MIGLSGNVPEKRLGDGHVLERDNALHPHQFDHPVDQEKGKAMRQDLENVANFHAGFHGLGLVRNRVCGVSHADSFKAKIIL
jgi:hypothetical protein